MGPPPLRLVAGAHIRAFTPVFDGLWGARTIVPPNHACRGSLLKRALCSSLSEP